MTLEAIRRASELGIECWKHVPDAGLCVEASNLGNLRNSQSKHPLKAQPMPTHTPRTGCYYQIGAPMARGGTVTKTAHKLVQLAFLGPSKLTVNHINGDKSDSRLCNLELVSLSTNVKKAFERGQVQVLRGENHPRAKYTSHQIRVIRALRAEGVPARYIGDYYGSTSAHISHIASRRIYKVVQ